MINNIELAALWSVTRETHLHLTAPPGTSPEPNSRQERGSRGRVCQQKFSPAQARSATSAFTAGRPHTFLCILPITSSTRSLCGRARHASTTPHCCSSTLTWARLITCAANSPAVILTLQTPQPPPRQPSGIPRRPRRSIPSRRFLIAARVILTCFSNQNLMLHFLSSLSQLNQTRLKQHARAVPLP